MHVAPHVSWAMALWAVLTRLKKPNSIHYPPAISTVISNMTPLEKAKLYATGEMSETLTPDERKILRSNLAKLKIEYINIPYYEGRMGASVRELKSILYDAAQNPEYKTISPISILSATEDFVKRVSEYEFLKQDIKDGYHDSAEFINVVRNEYLNIIDREIRMSLGVYDTTQWEDFIKRYIHHVAAVTKNEKIQNTITGKSQDPDLQLIDEFEKIVGAPVGAVEVDSFRKNAISQVGAWVLDHRGQPVVYGKVFPEYWNRLEKHFYETQKAVLTKMFNGLKLYGTPEAKSESEEGKLAIQSLSFMVEKLGYNEDSAIEAIHFLMKKRY